MAQPLQRRRHQEPAQLSRLATRPRSLGRPTRPRSLDQRRHRQRTIPTANAIRAKSWGRYVTGETGDNVVPIRVRSPLRAGSLIKIAITEAAFEAIAAM